MKVVCPVCNTERESEVAVEAGSYAALCPDCAKKVDESVLRRDISNVMDSSKLDLSRIKKDTTANTNKVFEQAFGGSAEPEEKSELDLMIEDISKDPGDFVRRLYKVKVVSSPTLQNKKILEYYDMVTCDLFLSGGMLTEFSGHFVDLFKMKPGGFEEKLNLAKESAINKLRYFARSQYGANMIIDTKINFSSIGTNLLMLSASGTPVLIEKDECDEGEE